MRGSFSVVCVRHGLVSSLFFPVGDPSGVNPKEGQFFGRSSSGDADSSPAISPPMVYK